MLFKILYYQIRSRIDFQDKSISIEADIPCARRSSSSTPSENNFRDGHSALRFSGYHRSVPDRAYKSYSKSGRND